MERPLKKPRHGPAPHEESDDDDELNYEPEEIAERRDPGVRLARSRATAAFRLKSTFESIFEKYERDFSGVGDEIDLRTGEIVVNNGHLQGMRNEKDAGLDAEDEEDEGISLRDVGAVRGVVGRTEGRGSPRGDEIEDQILQGRNSAVIQDSAGALVPRAPSNPRPLLNSRLVGPAEPPAPFGASPLFFGSWGPAGGMEPAWQAPQLQVPRFKSSFAADLFADRYRLPAREASKSIWGPGSHEDEDEEAPAQKPRMRLGPPTRRIPARPKTMKLIRAPPTNPDDSSDEDCILMGAANTLSVPGDGPSSAPQPQEAIVGADDDGALPELGESEAKPDGETMSLRSGRPVTRAGASASLGGPGELADQRRAKSSNNTQSPSPKGKKNTPVSEKQDMPAPAPSAPLTSKDELCVRKVVHAPVEISPTTSHDVHRGADRGQRKTVFVELRSSHLLDDTSYLYFPDVIDHPVESSLPTPPQDDDSASPAPEHQSNRTIPDSQEEPMPLPTSSALEPTAQETPRKPPQKEQKEKKITRSAYDFSDKESGFVYRPARKRKRKRKRIPATACSPATNERPHVSPSTGIEVAGSRISKHQPEIFRPRLEAVSPEPQDPSESMLSPARTASARAKAHPPRPPEQQQFPRPDQMEESTGRLRRGRSRKTLSLPSSDGSANNAVLVQADTAQPSPASSVSLPAEQEVAGKGAPVEDDCADTEARKQMISSVTALEENDHPLLGSTSPAHSAVEDYECDLMVTALPESRRTTRSMASVTTENHRCSSIASAPPPAPRRETRSMASLGTVNHERSSMATVPPLPESQRETEPRHAPSTRDVAAGLPSTAPSVPGIDMSPAPKDTPGGSGQRRATRSRAVEKAGSIASSSSPPSSSPPSPRSSSPLSLPSDRPEPIAPPAASQRSPGRSQGPGANATPSREPLAKSSVAGTPVAQSKPATPSRTPRLKLTVPDTPTSVPSTGRRSIISLVSEKDSSAIEDSEDELTTSTLWPLFEKPTPVQTSISKSSRRRRLLEATPTRSNRRSSAFRLSFGLSVERPSAPDESVMRTPGGTIRKCGERGLKCGKDFCFTCC